VQWQGLRAGDPVEAARTAMAAGYSPEAMRLLQEEGPKYQYGAGCLVDGMLGTWLATVCGLTQRLLGDHPQVRAHQFGVAPALHEVTRPLKHGHDLQRRRPRDRQLDRAQPIALLGVGRLSDQLRERVGIVLAAKGDIDVRAPVPGVR